jgi:hypothetical protein
MTEGMRDEVIGLKSEEVSEEVSEEINEEVGKCSKPMTKLPGALTVEVRRKCSDHRCSHKCVLEGSNVLSSRIDNPAMT